MRAPTIAVLVAAALLGGALPAWAAEETTTAPQDINGVLLALIVGVIIGVFVFLDAYASGDGGDHADH